MEAKQPPQYHCPGASEPITRAVHLSRLASSYPLCRHCPERHETGLLGDAQRVWLNALNLCTTGERFFSRDGFEALLHNEIDAKKMRRVGFSLGMWSRIAQMGLVHLEVEAEERPTATHLEVAIGCDGSQATQEFAAYASEGVRFGGLSTLELGIVPFPAFAHTLKNEKTVAGLYLFASPGEKRVQIRGLCFGEEGQPLAEEEALAELERVFAASEKRFRPDRKNGEQHFCNAVPNYLATLQEVLPHAEETQRILLDPRGGCVLRELLEANNFVIINEELDEERVTEQLASQNAAVGLLLLRGDQQLRVALPQVGFLAPAEIAQRLVEVVLEEPEARCVAAVALHGELVTKLPALAKRIYVAGGSTRSLDQQMCERKAVLGLDSSGMFRRSLDGITFPDALWSALLFLRHH